MNFLANVTTDDLAPGPAECRPACAKQALRRGSLHTAAPNKELVGSFNAKEVDIRDQYAKARYGAA